jgi:3-oxoacyl-[acyl-carrier protein] reductase
MSIQYSFPNKTVVVTGGARGIGLEISRQFLAAGAFVSIWDFAQENLDAAKAELAGLGDSIQYLKVDVGNMNSCNEAAAQVLHPIDVVVNNAGITRDKSFAKMTSEDFQAVINTNLTGVFNVTKATMGLFRPDSANKRVINISSVVALYGNFGQTNYVAAKAGVIGMTKTWARELAGKGFTVNAIAPGFTLTPMVEAMPAEARGAMESKVPVKRLGQPRDIANACLFLASDEASYITGITLSVDGGLVC